MIVVFSGTHTFLGSFFYGFSSGFLFVGLPFLYLDFIVVLGRSGVLSQGADCCIIFRVDKIWIFGTLSVYGLKVALHSLQLLKRACLYGCTCNDSNNNTHTHTPSALPWTPPSTADFALQYLRRYAFVLTVVFCYGRIFEQAFQQA